MARLKLTSKADIASAAPRWLTDRIRDGAIETPNVGPLKYPPEVGLPIGFAMARLKLNEAARLAAAILHRLTDRIRDGAIETYRYGNC